MLRAADEPVRTLVLTAVMTGMRRGELLGLKWEDVDLEGGKIHVRRALWRGKFVAPKSRRSRRAIDAPATVRVALTRLPSRFQGELVFCGPQERPLDPENFTKRDFARVLRRSGVRRIRFHDLRHRTPACSSRRARIRSTSRRSSATPRSRQRSIATGI